MTEAGDKLAARVQRSTDGASGIYDLQIRALEDRLALVCVRLLAEAYWAKSADDRDLADLHSFTIEGVLGDDAEHKEWRASNRRHPCYRDFRRRIREWLGRGVRKAREVS